MSDSDQQWYAVRCVFRLSGVVAREAADASNEYEERVTIWRAATMDEAIERAEREAHSYARDGDCEYLGLAQAFWMFDPPADGAEVFSLIRLSALVPDAYVSRFFDTGDEVQRSSDR